MSRKNRRQVNRQAAFMPAARSVELDQSYTHVKRDLRRIALLAGSFVVVLVVLSFFLN